MKKKVNEVWRPIPSFPNYAVSNYGQVKRIKKGSNTEPEKILAIQKPYDVMLMKKGKLYRRNVVQLAIEAFNFKAKTDIALSLIHNIYSELLKPSSL